MPLKLSEKQLNTIKEYALSNDDIQAILKPSCDCGSTTRILTYPQFATMISINEAFDDEGRCVFLFLTQSASGHWLCMFKTDFGIYYFDSYGKKPEAQREWLSEEELIALGEEEQYLYNLLRDSKEKVYYNTYEYQALTGTSRSTIEINSCGRWCVARLIHKGFSEVQFYNLILRKKEEYGVDSLDDVVAILTWEVLGK